MRICVVSSQVFKLGSGGLSGYGGLEQVAWMRAKGLAERGHQVALVAPHGSSCPGVEVIPCGPAGQWDEKKGFDQYWKRLLSFDAIVDDSWSKHAYMLKAEGVLKNKVTGKDIPVLGVMHAPVNTMLQSLPPVEKPCMVCISKDQAQHFEALFGRPCRWAYNAVDPEVYKPLGIPRTNRFLFCGRFSSIKGPLIAIKACKEAGVGLDLIGDTSITNEPEYYEACRKEADGEQIKILGGQSRGACVWWMSQAHAFIHSAFPFREPFGLAPVEAMLCGLPVIASDNGALRETVKQGRTGVVIKSEKELVYLIRSFKVDAKGDWWRNPDMRQECREWALQFSPQAMAQRYEELCTEAIEGGW